jgi:hypothetical protein
MKQFRVPVIAVLSVIVLLALNSTPLPATGPEIPAELVGAWTHIEWQANYGHYDPDKTDQFDYRNQDPVGWTDAYRFFSDGSYQHAHFSSLDIPGCDVKTLRQELGWFHLTGESVKFEDRTARLSVQDRCHRDNNFKGRPDKLAELRTLQWRLVRNRNGQLILMLRGSDGREIAYHRDPSGHI